MVKSVKTFKNVNKLSKADSYLKHRLLRVGYSREKANNILKYLSNSDRVRIADEIEKKAPIDEDDTITTPDYDQEPDNDDDIAEILDYELKVINSILKRFGVKKLKSSRWGQ